MIFSSIIFLFHFLPFTLAAYYIAPPRAKNTVLFICSLVFYCWGEVRFFPVMLTLILINYLCGLAIAHFEGRPGMRRLFLALALVGSLGMLFYFKYANFVLESANALLGTRFAPIEGISVLPLGISFYTFQTLSYTIDVYRHDVASEKNIIDFGAYVVMFPQLIAGPIVKYRDVAAQLHVYKHRYNIAQIEEGMTIFTFGLAKKVLLADAVGALWTDIIGVADDASVTFVGLANASTGLVWLGILAYSFQLYFDFSGYSMMAIGMGKMMGFEFPQNFNYPYISASITEFWRRWHISLSSWLRDYLYISLGGNRKGRVRTYVNLLLTMLLGGLWHGAAVRFILWGALHGVALALHKMWMAVVPWAKINGKDMNIVLRVAGIVLTFNLVCFGWLLFRAEDMQTVHVMLYQIFNNFNPAIIPQVVEGYKAVFALIVLGYAMHFLPEKIDIDIRNRVVNASFWWQVALMALTIWCVMQIKSSDIQPFIYFQF